MIQLYFLMESQLLGQSRGAAESSFQMLLGRVLTIEMTICTSRPLLYIVLRCVFTLSLCTDPKKSTGFLRVWVHFYVVDCCYFWGSAKEEFN